MIYMELFMLITFIEKELKYFLDLFPTKSLVLKSISSENDKDLK